MGVFSPKQRSEIVADLRSNVLANAPLTSSELGEVIDTVLTAFGDVLYEDYIEMENALSLLDLNTTTGSDLDDVASDFPDLAPRFDANNASGKATVTDPTITKIDNQVSLGGAFSTDTFLNVDDATSFPATGTLLVGIRGSGTFEVISYTSISGNQFILSAGLSFDHGSVEPVVLQTVGDRVFVGPFIIASQATFDTAVKQYISTTSLTIFDGEESGDMDVEAVNTGSFGNIASNVIVEFIGSPPFPGAAVTNNVPFLNGRARETDAELRARIRRERQSLSSANIDAVTSALLGIDFSGQRVVFAQIVEDPDPTLPALTYIDDGSGFSPTQNVETTVIVLIDQAVGGEQFFKVPRSFLPLVTTDSENAAFNFTGITLHLNGTPLTQGTAAGQFKIQPDQGDLRLVTPLIVNDKLEIISITHFTGLVQFANKTIYGDKDDRDNFKGINGLGQWLQVRVPFVQFVTIQGNVVLDGTRDIDDVVDQIKQNFLQYVNNLGIQESVIKSKIIQLAMQVSGVKNFILILPIGDVSIPDGTLARTTTGNITVT